MELLLFTAGGLLAITAFVTFKWDIGIALYSSFLAVVALLLGLAAVRTW